MDFKLLSTKMQKHTLIVILIFLSYCFHFSYIYTFVRLALDVARPLVYRVCCVYIYVLVFVFLSNV